MNHLQQQIKQYEFYKGNGTLKNVSEPLVMVVIDLQKALVLARKFQQNAVVLIKDQQPSKLIFLSCTNS